MKRIVFDADGLIKLTKAGVMDEVVRHYRCLISDHVYQEAVTEGKKRGHRDAIVIEGLIKNKQIDIVRTKRTAGVMGLGAGELSTLELYRQKNCDAIISDDRKFLTMLEQEAVNFIIPTDVIAMLMASGVIKKEAALSALDRIKELVRAESYYLAREAVGGKTK